MRERLAALPWWVHVLLIYGASRLFSTVVLIAVSRRQIASPWGPASPSYEEFVNFWDSGWYQRIHDGGYPVELPRGDDGNVLENQWAFYPLFPAAVRLLSRATGTGWNPASAILATVFGFIAALLIYRIFRLRASAPDARWAVALVAFFPVSPILQIPYAESLHLMLLALALYLVMTERFLAALPVVVLMSLARPAGVPFAIGLGLLLLVGICGRGSVRSAGGLIRLGALAVTAGLAALAWPAAAWLMTGEPDAYVQTETAWRGSDLFLFAPWLHVATDLLGPLLGPLALVAVAGALAWLLLSPGGRTLGLPLQLWCVGYLLYLAAFWHPQTSTFRILLPLFPLALAAVLLSGSRAYRLLAVAGFGCLQIVWVAWLWAWLPLFGGGDYSP
ncbi:hypothetical protein GC088_10665 [Arthrobacter sp. JZ12]|uniref:hypothetical protein n=1 Tax=Arthrobacter sp. JZ12 TaxID=2654190 RepID=UPI002B47D7BF|nr:hypothetical protein [Arthrobacter sp. JZ12]WRH26510.1 hypothetical protein GC088_10665 [Arthrobacter sp. JZ12]